MPKTSKKEFGELRETREALLNILEDVEETRKEAEEERDKTLAIIENFPEGLLFFDKKSNLSSINPKAQDFFGLKAEKLLGKSVSELTKIASLAPLMDILGKDLKPIYRQELKLKEDLIVEVSTIEVVSGEEKVGTLVSLRDVTREKILRD